MAETKARHIHSPSKNNKKILALDKGKFKPSSPVITPVEKRNASKFYELHEEAGIDECMHLNKKIEEMPKAGKLKGQDTGDTDGTTMEEGRQKITQTLSPKSVTSFLPLCGDEEHSTSTWMNFMVVKLPYLYNRLIRRPGVAIHPEYSEKTIAIGSTLTEEGRKELCSLLRRNLDIFASKPANMTKVPWDTAEYKLNIREGCIPVRKKKIGQAPERTKAICEEVENLVDADFMKEDHYHSWLSNPVMVKNMMAAGGSAKEALSAVLMTKRDGKQMPIYFISRALPGPKVNYTSIENLILALRTGRTYGSCIDGSGACLIITNPEGMEFTYALRFRFNATNNEAEYEALTVGLRISKQMRIKNLQENVDSRLVANQVNSVYIAKEPGMIKYLEKVKNLAIAFKEFSIKQAAAGKLRFKGDPRGVMQHACHAKIRGRENFNIKGIDIAGPFVEDPDKVNFLIVVIDYFTKWIEAKLMAAITRAQVKKFVWDNIVCRSGLPGEIISDNGKQFRDNPFKDWREKLCEGIKAWVDERSKNWLEEISRVLWAHRTMIKSSNEETPISLTYGAEAVIPMEIGMPTLGTVEVDMIKNDEALRVNLDLLEDKRQQAAIQEAKRKAKMEKYYNAMVRNTSFLLRDLIYQNNVASHAKDGRKLENKWEGPYEVTKALGNGAYKLRDHNGNTLPRTWNVCNLKKCYMHEM
nr:reverse transcriptase domain-containing protein [Tanacetum cinerariifolium]